MEGIASGFLHVVRVCIKGFDCHSSAKRSPFSPTTFVQQHANLYIPDLPDSNDAPSQEEWSYLSFL